MAWKETAASTTSLSAANLPVGPWRGVLATQGQEIPFLFEVKTEAGKPVVYLVNKGISGEERLPDKDRHCGIDMREDRRGQQHPYTAQSQALGAPDQTCQAVARICRLGERQQDARE